MPESESVQAINRQAATQDAEREARRQAHDAASFTPHGPHERLLRVAEADPDAPARLGVGLEFALYRRTRAAAIAAGAFDPDTYTEEN